MISVRWKLAALVVASSVPVLVGVIADEKAAEARIFEEAAEDMEAVGARFDDTVEEYEKNARLALTFGAESGFLQKALGSGDVERLQRFVDRLGAVYKYRVILLANASGQIVAGVKKERGPASLAPSESAEFAGLLAGKPLVGLIPVRLPEGPGYTMINAAPVLLEGKQVGVAALLSPINARYLAHLEKKIDAQLALHIQGQLLASTAGHAAPRLKSTAPGVTFTEQGQHVFAVRTFRPAGLQRPGLVVELTASRDVTTHRNKVRAALERHLIEIGASCAAVLAIALWLAGRMGKIIQGIDRAAGEVKEGRYVQAPTVHTGDELESLTVHFNEMVQGLKERDRLKETFGRYVTRQVADHLMKADQQLGGDLVPVTILFSDIRSFTSISESMPPRELLDFLNEYFSGMVESVLTHNGVVDKFIGDAIMAVFGAPVPEEGDALNAVRSALDMRERLRIINEGFRQRGLPEIRTGIGLHTGQVVAGNMGHAQRMEYTVIGDAVNLASRLEGMTKELGCDIILSDDLYQQVQDSVVAEPLRKIKVKGREQEVLVHRLIGLRDDPV
jgi:class 3 adenylate cyclase